MLSRLGFLGRISVIVLALLLAFTALAVAISFTARERREGAGERFPVPAQAAAIVDLLERTGGAEQQLALNAVSSDSFTVTVAHTLPAGARAGTHMPAVEWLVGQYLQRLPQHQVIAFRRTGAQRSTERLERGGERPIVIAVALRSGGYAVFEVRGDSTRRLFGTPVGLWIGLFGFLFAAAAFWAIAREARPLGELARSVNDFAGDGQPRNVRMRGAPEIRRLIGSSNAMQTRIAGLIKGRTMLLGAVSHDLKTYITRLRLRAEMIDSADQRERAVRDLDEMTGLIDDVLAVARGTQLSDRGERFDLRALCADEIARRSDRAIALVSSEDAQTVAIDGDPVAIRRVLANVLDNAGRYGRHCRVSVTTWQGHAVVAVEDDGPGIPEAEREAIFEPFYRLEGSRSRRTGGSGLGLAIARQIVEAHGGTITAERSPALGGACFRIRFRTCGDQR